MTKRLGLWFLGSVLLTVSSGSSAFAETYNFGMSSSWLAQIGVTQNIENAANGGNGFKLGIVDSGITSNLQIFAGRVSNASGCAARTFSCAKGAMDDHGHGTAVAAIAAGSMAKGGVMAGVAPKVTLIAEKVLNASGSGYDVDVANGITKAADAGAQVINLSVSYIPSASMIKAINAATAKGAILVFAGGNSSKTLNNGLNTTGLTSAALARLVFVGSVKADNTISGFSNKPGNGAAVAGNARASYASLWLMAPGERIAAPYITRSADAYAAWTGTSMAAPVVSGALALLETTWPMLARNGTATSVLFQAATDLGGKGVDTTYGNGLLNLDRAFQPLGILTVAQPNGKRIAVSSLSGSVLTRGALGSLNSIRSRLASTTSLDGFQRNFTVDLSPLIANRNATGAQAVRSAKAPQVTSFTTRFADGGAMSAASIDQAAQVFLDHSTRAALQPASDSFMMEMVDAQGGVMASGTGFPVSASFADALWGFGSQGADAARSASDDGVMSLAEGGRFVAWGRQIDGDTRFGFAWSETRDHANGLEGSNAPTVSASAYTMGLTRRLADLGTKEGWVGGLTVGMLSEKNGLLGTAYSGTSPVSFGDSNRSFSLGASSAFDLGRGAGLLLDATYLRTEGAAVSNGLISQVSPLTALAYGATLVQREAFRADDRLSLGVRKPLRVISGNAALAVTEVDSQGYATTRAQRVSLKPDGSQTDFVLGYATPLARAIDFTSALSLSKDADNVRGRDAAGVTMGVKVRF